MVGLGFTETIIGTQEGLAQFYRYSYGVCCGRALLGLPCILDKP